mmetsp:Transcript_12269/g.29946  ORF Transcript_12269/g.29946 Transcript_12269/m.29946 type:complete len:232 (+) Transcript_12269:1475-2170(+)
MMQRSPRVPVPLRMALRAMACSASRVYTSLAPDMASSVAYCLHSADLGSVSTLTSCSSVSSASDTMIGRRPTNSGMSPKLMRSVCSTCCSTSLGTLPPPGRPVSRARTWLPKPSDATTRASSTWRSRSTNAPPTMNRMSRVSTWMKSPRGFLRPPFSGTLTTVPSSILSSACCTPSPLTSRVTVKPSWFFLAILSISSTYTMPACATSTWKLHACSSLYRTLSTSSPTYPA